MLQMCDLNTYNLIYCKKGYETIPYTLGTISIDYTVF